MSNRIVFTVAALAGLLLCCAVGVARAATADGNTEETVIKSGELRVRLFAVFAFHWAQSFLEIHGKFPNLCSAPIGTCILSEALTHYFCCSLYTDMCRLQFEPYA